MISLLFTVALAINVGPAAPETPAREPQLAASGANVALAYGAGQAIYVSMSADSGKTFSAPVKVVEAEVVALNRHRGPRIAWAGHTLVLTAVLGKTPATGQHAHGLATDGDLIALRSTDGGRTWSKGVPVNDVPGAPTEGLHSLASDARGNLFAAWLDHRGGHGTKLYGARSTDAGLTWSKNALIYESPEGTICECCHPSIAIDGSGQILVTFRNWLAGSRDIYLTRSRDGMAFSKPEKLGTGTWQINACPMDGGGIVLDHGRVVTAWRREHGIFLASPGEPEAAIGDGTDVAIAAAGKGIYALWSTPEGLMAHLPGENKPRTLAAKGAFPAVTELRDGRALAAWEDNGRIQVQLLP